MKTIIALALAAFSSLSFGATLTIDNQSTHTYVMIPKKIYPACVTHPASDCTLPPQKKTEYTLPDLYNLETFQLVSTPDPDSGKFTLNGSASYSYRNEEWKGQVISCNTINKDAVSIQIVIEDMWDATCQTKEDHLTRFVDWSSGANMTITIRDL